MSFLSFHLESILFILHWMPSQIFNIFMCVSFNMHFRTILLPSFTIQNILKVLILFMNWGKRNPDKSNASYRIVHIHACIYTAVLQIYGSLMVNHVNLFFCSPSFLSQRKTSFHRKSFTSKRNIEGPFVFRSWKTYIY